MWSASLALLYEWAADPTGTVDVSVFAQYGVLGVLVVLLIWFAKGAYQRERDRADRLEGELAKLHEALQDRALPVLLAATNAVQESTELLAAMQRERERDTQRRGGGS